MNIQITDCRIYVACLASYNSGILHGEWIDATEDKDEMQEEVNRILRASPEPNVMVLFDGKMVPSAEEWAIHDHEGLGDISEYAGLQEVARRCGMAAVADEFDVPLCVLIEAMESQSDDADAQDYMQDNYCGKYNSWADYAEEFHEDVGDLSSVPESLRYHIDWDSVGREMSQEKSGVEHKYDLYIFHSN